MFDETWEPVTEEGADSVYGWGEREIRRKLPRLHDLADRSRAGARL
jgi:hypothetical protein